MTKIRINMCCKFARFTTQAMRGTPPARTHNSANVDAPTRCMVVEPRESLPNVVTNIDTCMCIEKSKVLRVVARVG